MGHERCSGKEIIDEECFTEQNARDAYKCVKKDGAGPDSLRTFKWL